MNAHVFRRVCQALTPRLLGARLEKIHALAPGVTQWSFYGQHERFALIVRAHRQKPFLFTLSKRLAVGTEPPSGIMRLRKYLAGQRVTACFCQWADRKLWLRFCPGAAVWLSLDLRQGPELCWDEPQALSGLDAETGLSFADPAWPSVDRLPAAGSDALAAVWRDWPVLTPALRRTLVELPREEQAALLADLESGGGDLFVYRNASGTPVVLSAWPLPPALRDGLHEQVVEDPLEAAALVGQAQVIGDLAAQAAAVAAKPFTAEAGRLRRLQDKLDREEERLRGMAEAGRDALALQHALYRFAPDTRFPQLTIETPEGTRTIDLDPRLTVRENMSALFHRARRGRRGLAMLKGRKEQVAAALQDTRQSAEVAASLGQVTGQIGPRQAGKPSGRADGKQANALAAKLPRGVQAFYSSDGLLLLRGKDARGNVAALKLARPEDLWLHAESAAGAHVIVRRVPGQPVPETTLHEAAGLAALKSPYKDAATASVQCALVKHVHPMRGAASGMVRIDRHEPGLTVRLEQGLEERLQKA